MNARSPKPRRGMTLPELLIVVAIIGLLAVTVLPALGTTTDARRTREAARLVSGFCARAQSSAIGKPEWAGLLIAPDAGSTGAPTLRLAKVPSAYTGAVLNARLAVQSGTAAGPLINTALPESACPTINTAPSATPLEIADIATAGVRQGDLIRFDNEGVAYEVLSATPAVITFQIRGSAASDHAGFSASNLPWPARTPATHTFQIFRGPVPAGQPFDIPNGRVLDVGWSGYGPANDPAGASYTAFNTPGQPIVILFDATGRARLIMRGSSRVVPRYPIYLLVGRADRLGNTSVTPPLPSTDDSIGVNWQYPESWWIAIDPLTGAVRSAECKPNAVSVTDSQEFVRKQL